MSVITQAMVDDWRASIGKIESRTEVPAVETLRRFAAAIDEDLDVERIQPSLAHWAFFLPVAPDGELNVDGHTKRGGFLPAITLPRRMFAATRMTFGPALKLGQPATKTSTIADVQHKSGRTGDLVFVEVDHAIVQDGAACVTERQTIVFRDAGERTPPVVPADQAPVPHEHIWQPGPVELFRFSAVTFNSHRIHYDAPYAVEDEGYPGLVVHGPFTAAKLYGYAHRHMEQPLKSFTMRASAPLFVGQPIRLRQGATLGEYRALRCDGQVSMTVNAGF